ncbi:hypothetical protein [Enterococcus alishanensis]|uniref:ATPase V n=1 Tax=Enterococcus alishanensis TaxID=1303817 RepID=A0ABS6T9H4_9ENTE|nr:hypothetical protein [Enterococcus alishanensis]MBV7389541.1 hypothetical protein [Enterococcus alishanensis]
MDAIEKIIDQLNEEAQLKQTEFQVTEKMRIEQEFQASLQEIELEQKKRYENQLDQLEEKNKQLKNRQQVAAKQANLNLKQQLLDEMFIAAQEAMNDWSIEEHQNFANGALKKLAVSGSLKFISGGITKDVYTEEWLAIQNAQLKYQLTLSDEVIPNQAGFILDQAGIQYNFLYQTLIEEQKETLSFELAQTFLD